MLGELIELDHEPIGQPNGDPLADRGTTALSWHGPIIRRRKFGCQGGGYEFAVDCWASAAFFRSSIARSRPSAICMTSGMRSGQALSPKSMLSRYDITVMFKPPPSKIGPTG